MGDYEETTMVAVSADELFGYLQDVKNLPHYLPRLTSVEPSGNGTYTVTAHIHPEGGESRDVEGEARISVKAEGRTLAWGAAGPHNYSGELDVDPGDDAGTSRLTVRLHTERAEGPSIEKGLTETLAALKHAAESASVE